MDVEIRSMPQPRTAKIATSSEVQWDNGEPFNGYVWLGLRIATGYTLPAIPYSPRNQAVPKYTKIHITNGEVDSTPEVFWNIDLQPPGSNYVAYYFTPQNVLVAPGSGSATAFSVATSTHYLTVPTLAVPSLGSAVVPET